MKHFLWVTLFICVLANGFELKTHIYIGEEIADDLSDGKLTIPPFGNFNVNSDLKESILNNPQYFLAGTMGPDVFPDFLAGQVTVHTGEYSGWKTDDWLKHFSATPSENGDKWEALYRGYLLHAAGDIFAHTYVNTYAGDVFDLGDEDLLDVEIRHKLLELYIAKHQPNNTVDTSWINSLDTQLIKSKFIDDASVAQQYRLSTETVYLYKMREYELEVEELASPLSVLKRAILSVIESEAERQQYYEELIARYDEQHGEKNEQIRTQQQIIDDLTPAAKYAVCEYIYTTDDTVYRNGDDPSTPWEEAGYREVTKSKEEKQREGRALGLCRWKKEVDKAILNLILAEEELEDLKESLTKFYEDNPDLAEAADRLGIAELTREEAVQALVLVAAAIVFADELDLKAIALDVAITQYQKYIVQEAGEEYIQANIQVAGNIVNGQSLFEATAPLRDWLSCWSPVYLLEIGTIIPATCAIEEEFENLLEQLEETVKEYTENTELLNLYNTYQSIQEEFKDLGVRLGKDIVRGVLSDEHQEIIGLLANPVTDEILTAAFSRTGHDSHLLPISDIVSRLRSDMDLDSFSKFNPESFAPIFNAIQLSKISLLDESEVNRLELLAGSVETNFSSHYFNGEFNFLFSWVGSIDGNHQWMPISPKLPREEGYPDTRESVEREFSVNGGLDLWNNVNSRDSFFEKIFKGPISKGIESPDLVGESPIVPSTYENRNCYAEPFPYSSEEFTYCLPIAAWLIPVLSILN